MPSRGRGCYSSVFARLGSRRSAWAGATPRLVVMRVNKRYDSQVQTAAWRSQDLFHTTKNGMRKTAEEIYHGIFRTDQEQVQRSSL
jgi:hypothetical protein